MSKKKKETKMNQEVSVNNKSEMASPEDVAAWGNEPLTADDIVIPRILFMQGLSAFVTEGKAKFGDIVESLNKQVLGGLDAGVEILPFKRVKVLKVMDEEGKCLSSEPLTPENISLSFKETEVDGVAGKYFIAHQFYVLLPQELETGGAIPYMVEFKSTALKSGKAMGMQMFAKNKDLGIGPAGKTFMLSSKKDSNARHSWSVPEVAVLRDASKEERDVAYKWYKTLNGEVQIHENEA